MKNRHLILAILFAAIIKSASGKGACLSFSSPLIPTVEDRIANINLSGQG
jgi:hypothetical protein